LGKFAEGRRAYQRTIAAEPHLPPAYLNLGVLYDLYLADRRRRSGQCRHYIQLAGENNSRRLGVKCAARRAHLRHPTRSPHESAFKPLSWILFLVRNRRIAVGSFAALKKRRATPSSGASQSAPSNSTVKPNRCRLPRSTTSPPLLRRFLPRPVRPPLPGRPPPGPGSRFSSAWKPPPRASQPPHPPALARPCRGPKPLWGDR